MTAAVVRQHIFHCNSFHFGKLFCKAGTLNSAAFSMKWTADRDCHYRRKNGYSDQNNTKSEECGTAYFRE